MNDFKKPTALISGTNLIFSIGSFAYFYKKIEQLEKENQALKKEFETLTKNMQDFKNADIQTEELLKKMHKEVKEVKMLKEDSSLIEQEIKIIKDALEEGGLSVKTPKKYRKESDEDLIYMLKGKK